MIDGRVFDDILNANSLEEVYEKLLACSFLGGFLAYQYTIDLNYSPYLNFSENSFVKAGIGAIRGIRNVLRVTEHVMKMPYIIYKIILPNYS